MDSSVPPCEVSTPRRARVPGLCRSHGERDRRLRGSLSTARPLSAPAAQRQWWGLTGAPIESEASAKRRRARRRAKPTLEHRPGQSGPTECLRGVSGWFWRGALSSSQVEGRRHPALSVLRAPGCQHNESAAVVSLRRRRTPWPPPTLASGVGARRSPVEQARSTPRRRRQASWLGGEERARAWVRPAAAAGGVSDAPAERRAGRVRHSAHPRPGDRRLPPSASQACARASPAATRWRR